MKKRGRGGTDLPLIRAVVEHSAGDNSCGDVEILAEDEVYSQLGEVRIEAKGVEGGEENLQGRARRVSQALVATFREEDLLVARKRLARLGKQERGYSGCDRGSGDK